MLRSRSSAASQGPCWQDWDRTALPRPTNGVGGRRGSYGVGPSTKRSPHPPPPSPPPPAPPTPPPPPPPPPHVIHWMKTSLKLSVGVPGNAYLLAIKGLSTQGWRPGRTSSESFGGTSEMDNSDWSDGSRYHIFDTRPDTEFNELSVTL